MLNSVLLLVVLLQRFMRKNVAVFADGDAVSSRPDASLGIPLRPNQSTALNKRLRD
jgi:hypothetical protein